MRIIAQSTIERTHGTLRYTVTTDCPSQNTHTATSGCRRLSHKSMITTQRLSEWVAIGLLVTTLVTLVPIIVLLWGGWILGRITVH